jgi:transcription elongation GreA/GreB family factor
MHPEVAKLVEAGRIPAAVGERLSELAPGRFCLHKSWGAGKVIEWDLLGGRVTVDFERQSGQEMGLKLAIQKTEPLPDDDFRARKVEQIEELRELSASDPVEMVVHLLQSHGGSMSLDALEKELCGPVVAAEQFKKWWELTKKALRQSRRAVVPAKRTEPLVLRDDDLSPAQSLVADFEAARDLKSMLRAMEAIAGELRLFDDEPETLARLLADIDEACRKGLRLHLAEVIELLIVRDDIIGRGRALELDPAAVRLCDVVAAESDRIAAAVAKLAASRQRVVFEAFPQAFGDEWVGRLLEVFDQVGSRGVGEIAKLVEQHGRMEELERHLATAITRRSLGQDALIWTCRERHGAAARVFGPEVGGAVLNLLEEDHLAEGPRKTTRLQGVVVEDRSLIGDLVGKMDTNEARNFGRRLMECPVFGELDRKSLMARVIKANPETQELVAGEPKRKRKEDLIVSWESLEKRQAELDDIVRNRIPQNTRDIAVARSYGDLRENFEYKSAKQMQAVLMRRKRELEGELARARGSDFKGIPAEQVGIGTIVTLVADDGTRVDWTVLGAWDSDPEQHRLSYLSEFGAALVGLEPGAEVTARDPLSDEQKHFKVESIRPFNP